MYFWFINMQMEGFAISDHADWDGILEVVKVNYILHLIILIDT